MPRAGLHVSLPWKSICYLVTSLSAKRLADTCQPGRAAAGRVIPDSPPGGGKPNPEQDPSGLPCGRRDSPPFPRTPHLHVAAERGRTPMAPSQSPSGLHGHRVAKEGVVGWPQRDGQKSPELGRATFQWRVSERSRQDSRPSRQQKSLAFQLHRTADARPGTCPMSQPGPPREQSWGLSKSSGRSNGPDTVPSYSSYVWGNPQTVRASLIH